jgi:hypothetical protein
MKDKPEVPEVLNTIVDKVLSYRPKPKTTWIFQKISSLWRAFVQRGDDEDPSPKNYGPMATQ